MSSVTMIPFCLRRRLLLASRRFLILLCLFVLIAGYPFVLRAADGGYVAGEILVRYDAAATMVQIEALEREYGLELISEIAHLKTRHYKLPDTVTVERIIRDLETNVIVETVGPNYIHRPQAIPSDTDFPEQWSLHNTGQVVNGVAGPADVDIDWPEAMDVFTGTGSVVVAVIDSGVEIDHPEIGPNLWSNSGEVPNGIDDDGNGYVDDLYGWDFVDEDNAPSDGTGHGTLVAGLIAAETDNTEGLAGVASNTSIMVLRTLDNLGGGGMGLASTAKFLLSTTYAAEMGADIINYSIGGAPYSVFEDAQMGWLDSQGVLFVAAAGNGGLDSIGDDNDLTPFYPASYQWGNVISVASVDREGELAAFSNYGATRVHLAAPGEHIYGADVTRATVFSEDFDSGATGWTQGHEPDSLSPYDWVLYTDGLGDTWLSDSVDGLGFATSYSAYTNSWAQSPKIGIGSNPVVEFTAWHDIEYLYDLVYVEASTDGVSWDPLGYLTGYSYSLCPSCSVDAGTRYFMDLSAYEESDLFIRFRMDTDQSVQYDGIYIDDLAVRETAAFSYDGTQYRYQSGTSFSAPLVSGVAALLMSQRPGLSHRQIRRIVLDSVSETSPLSGLVATNGLLNANAAVVAAMSFEPGVIGFPADNVTAEEGGGSVSVRVIRSFGSDGAASIGYETQDLDATAGSDFVAAAGTVFFADGETEKSITIDLLDDAVAEDDESFNLVLSNVVDADIGGNTVVAVTIDDDDNHGSLHMRDASYSADESETVVVTVLREGGSDGEVSVDYTTGDGSALEDVDYTDASGSLVWPNGDTSPRTISIPLIDDNVDENNETLTISLSAPAGGATLGMPWSAIISIVDDDDQDADSAGSSAGDAGGSGGGGGGSLDAAALLALLATLFVRRRCRRQDRPARRSVPVSTVRP